jgi:hypothetical protein
LEALADADCQGLTVSTPKTHLGKGGLVHG